MQDYLKDVRTLCDEYGIVLIFDEVKTGFRVARGGAQELYGVTPDLCTFAKAMGNGYPIAALCGKRSFMSAISGFDGVLHGGTFNAQPVAMAALVATQKALTPEHYERSSVHGQRLQDGIRTILREAGIKAQVAGFPLMFHVAFGLDAPARNYRDVARADKAAYSRFAHELLKRGVRVLERGAWFVSSEHDAGVVDATLEAVRGVAREVA